MSNRGIWQHLGDDTPDTLQGCRTFGEPSLQDNQSSHPALCSPICCGKNQGFSKGNPFIKAPCKTGDKLGSFLQSP